MKRRILWLFLIYLAALTLMTWSCGRTTKDEEEAVPEEKERVYDQMDTSALLILANNLERGEPYVQRFKHFMTGDILERRIIGVEDGNLLYIEEMPGGFRLECRYSPESVKTVAQYYRDCANAGGEPSGKTYIINGKEVENPLQECINIGECIAIEP